MSDKDPDDFVEFLLKSYPKDDSRLQEQIRCLEDNLNVQENVNMRCKTFSCYYCNRTFALASKLTKHQRNGCNFPCKRCRKNFTSAHDLCAHATTEHRATQIGDGAKSSASDNFPPHKTKDKTVLLGKGRVRYIYPRGDERYDLLTFFSDTKGEIMSYLRETCEELLQVKWYLNINVQMIKPKLGENEEDELASAHFQSKTTPLLTPEDIEDGHDINIAFQKIFKSFDQYLRNGSNWTLKRIYHAEINIAKYKPLGGGSYIPLPPTLKAAHALLNIKNSDNKCFVWAVLASLHEISSDNVPARVEHYKPFEQELNMQGIEIPVAPSSLKKFEQQNDISVMALGFEDGEFFPLHATTLREDASHQVNLLYLTKENKSHWYLIKNLNRLLSRTKCKGRSHRFCRFCLQGFINDRVLDKHLQYCSKFDAQHVSFPTKGKDDVVCFQDYNKKQPVNFVIYADFETFTERMDANISDDEHSSTTKLTRLTPCGYGYKVVCIDDNRYTSATKIYRGDNVSEHFLRSLLKENAHIQAILHDIQPLKMTAENEESFKRSTKCHICEKSFLAETVRVRDHCHLTGVYRGAACQSCNINFKQPTFVPVVFHNLRSFDSHIICASLGLFKEEEVTCIASNTEKYISFSLGKLRFIDSYQFLDCSLEELVESLPKENPQQTFKHFTSEYNEERQLQLLLRKGIYPYEYVDNAAKFDDRQLPNKEMFYSHLSGKHISESDYSQAQKVWEMMGIQNLGQYHDLYLRIDVLLLADVFENFRQKSLHDYQLDPAHFYTLPGLSWQAALKMTGVKLELITDPTMWLFFEKSIRGGLTMVSRRHAKANNTYLGSSYDPSKPSSFLVYFDCTNLYGVAMSQSLPVSGFRWLDQSEIEQFDVQNVSESSDQGYVIECDLVYPKHMHDRYNDLPLATEKCAITPDMLSPYTHQLYKHIHGDVDFKPATKLLATLRDKDRYILHYRNLQLYLKLGLQLTKIHNVVAFLQKPWLKQYIDFNTEMRKKSKSNFEKKFHKKANNSFYGKSMESLRKRRNFSLVHRWDKFQKMVAKSSFQRFRVFNENLAGVHMAKTNLLLNKPIYLGQIILDLSKAHMIDFYYNHIKATYEDNVTMCYTDTDSLILKIDTEDVYRDMASSKHLYDLSNYPHDHFLYSDENKGKLGTFKDECQSKPIEEFVALRAKMYAFILSDKTEAVTAKGIKTRNLRFDQYKQTLMNNTKTMSEMHVLRSYDHQIHMVKILKAGLSSFEDKRYYLDSIHSLAYGHKDIQK